MVLFDFFHKLFRVSYKLHIAHDTKKGIPVIFLHGIASDSSTWDPLLPLLPDRYRKIAIDLLGFGASPKPKNNRYTTEDHINAIHKTISSLLLKEQVILVGHSMGGLLAIEFAKVYPSLVSQLFVISTPLYNQQEIIESTSKYATTKRSFGDLLFIMYEKVLSSENTTLKTAQTLMRLAPQGNSFKLTKDTWIPFKESLTNTIMRQTSLEDISNLSTPITLFYGKLDLLLQHKNYVELSNLENKNISVVSLTSTHMISKNSAKIIAKDMVAKI
jgi:cis-3-alkyl-4-acyloxetan-2-one decarboxylase